MLRLRSTRAALVVSGVVALGLCLSPLLGAPGIESAVVFGLLLPPFAGAIGARIVDLLRQEEDRVEPAEVLADATSGAVILAALPTAILLLNTLRNPVCAPLEGLGFFVLGPVFSVILAAAVGVICGALFDRPRLGTTAAVLAPLVLALMELWGFYATPAIYAYGHLFGYFPGTIYDPDITLTATYGSFRVLSLVWLLAIWASFTASWNPETQRPDTLIVARRWRLGLTAAGLALVGVFGMAWGPELGHRSTAESIEEALGGRLEGERCVVIHPAELPRADAARLAADCDFRVRRVEQVMGVRQPAPITAYFFRSADEKRAQMGASNTYIAKPWRREVYLQVREWPHPVLFHELAHVVAGNVGTGPFRIAGTLGGLLPSPAIIEGTAVAVAWEPRDGLTPHQWARAMLEVDLAPPMSEVEGLGFLLQPASRAYTASGSMVRWMMDTRGDASLRQLYMTGDWEAALGQPLEDAERDWHRFLREEVELPEEARALAQLRFERPGIWGQICPHRIANLRAELGAELGAGDDARAAGTCREILELDEGQAGTRAALVGALARLGQRERAESELSQLVGPPSAAPPVVQEARKQLADALWRRDRGEEAGDIYRALLEDPMSDDDRRQIAVRLLALEMGGAGEAALRGLLVPRRDAQSDAATAMHFVARLSRVREDGLAPYLEARQLQFRQRFDLALPLIERARERGLPSPLLETEARRMEAMIRFGADDLDGSAAVWRAILADPASDTGERAEAEDWLQRVVWARAR